MFHKSRLEYGRSHLTVAQPIVMSQNLVSQWQTDLYQSPDPLSYLAKLEALLLLSHASVPSDQLSY